MLCSVCKVDKDRSEFYNCWFTYGGFFRSCKNCDRLRNRNYRKNYPESVGRSNRRYYLKHKEREAERKKIYYSNNKDKFKARRLAWWAIYRGELVRQSCEKCGKEKTMAHHDDYSKPLDVRWLCSSCHVKHHRGIE